MYINGVILFTKKMFKSSLIEAKADHIQLFTFFFSATMSMYSLET